jgi:hypothetical protein
MLEGVGNGAQAKAGQFVSKFCDEGTTAALELATGHDKCRNGSGPVTFQFLPPFNNAFRRLIDLGSPASLPTRSSLPASPATWGSTSEALPAAAAAVEPFALVWNGRILTSIAVAVLLRQYGCKPTTSVSVRLVHGIRRPRQECNTLERGTARHPRGLPSAVRADVLPATPYTADGCGAACEHRVR